VVDVLGMHAHGLDDQVHRHAEAAAGALDHHHVGHRHRQRQRQADGRALAAHAAQFDAAVDALDRGAHHVHADAAARQVADLLGRAEAGQEDQLHRLVVAQRGGAVGRDQAAFHGLGTHPNRCRCRRRRR
jgi:hypothetical protein